MKKLVLLVVLAVVTTLSGCTTALEKRNQNLSELRDEVMIAKTDEMSVTLISGVRENPFEVNGQTGERTDFTVVTLSPTVVAECDYAFTVKIGEEIRSGNFTRHPIKNTYSFELPIRAKGEVFLSVTSQEKTTEFNLVSVKSEKTISAEKALEIAEQRLRESIKSVTVDGKLNCEIFIRYIENPISSEENYFWYIAYAPEKYTTFAVLVDPISGEVVAVRE